MGFEIFLQERISCTSQARARQRLSYVRSGLHFFFKEITWKKLRFESAERIAFQGMIIMDYGVWASRGNIFKAWPAQQ